jgi:hypothetical protein
VRLALRADVLQVLSSVAAVNPRIAAGGRPIVLLDAIHKYDKELLTELLDGNLLGHFGFGSNAANRIPTVLSFAVTGAALDFLRSVVEAPLARPWLLRHGLNAFREDGEDVLAYERVLLHPFNPNLMPQVSDRAWVVSPEADVALVEYWRGVFRLLLEGWPKSLTDRVLYKSVRMARDANCLREADDEDLLRRLRQ